MSEDKTRILVVDDEPMSVWIVRTNLEARGYKVLVAGDGETAIELAAKEWPDLIVLDIRMPGLDGYAVCRHIRGFSMVPIIMLTALADEADRIRGLRLGADDYVTKPFSADELVARVRAVLRRVAFSKQKDPWPVLQPRDPQVNFAQQRVPVGD